MKLSKIYLEQGLTDSETHRKMKKIKLPTKFAIGIVTIICLFLIVAVAFLAVSKNQELRQMQDEIIILRRDVFMLKYQNLDENLFDEIKAFEKELYADAKTPKEEVTRLSEDAEFDGLMSYDYDSNEEDEEDRSIDMDDNKQRIRKREVLSATIDGVPIIAESYAERKRLRSLNHSGERLKHYDSLESKSTRKVPTVNRNNTKHRSLTWTSLFDSPTRNVKELEAPRPTAIMSRASRVMKTDEDKSKAFRRIVKKSVLKSGSARSEELNYSDQVGSVESVLSEETGTVTPQRRRRLRHRNNLESMDEKHRQGPKKITPVIHFNGDSSKYIYEHQPHYEGNGRLKHPHGYVDWSPASWVKSLGTDRHFQLRNEHLTIKESGLYFIYAQIFYLDAHDTNGYKIMKNKDLLAQCTTTSHSNSTLLKGNTCFTATADYLLEGDILKIKDIGNMRISLFEPGKSFFGLVKISDAKIK